MEGRTSPRHEARDEQLPIDRIDSSADAVNARQILVQTLNLGGVDRRPAHQRRPEVARVPTNPPMCNPSLFGNQSIPLQILERLSSRDQELVGEGRKRPLLGSRVGIDGSASRQGVKSAACIAHGLHLPRGEGTPAHERITPVETRAFREAHVDALAESSVRKRNQRIPMAVKRRRIGHVIGTEECGMISRRETRRRRLRTAGVTGSRRMNLKRRLGREPDAGAALEPNDLFEGVAGKDARRGRGENHVQAVAFRKAPADSKRRLRVLIGEHCAPAATRKDELEPRKAANIGGLSTVASEINGQTAARAQST